MNGATLFDQTYDVVVVGSGAAGLSTAMSAADRGLRVLILESTGRWGGNSAMSGGGMWLPANPLMAREGVRDSREEALEYLEATVGDTGRSTSRARKEAFVDSVADFVTLAESHGITLVRATDYPDYYPELPGGKIGRSLEVKPFDLKRIGAWRQTCQMQTPLPVKTDDVWLLGRAWSSPAGFGRGAKFVLRTAGSLARGQRVAGMGAALTGSLLDVVVQQQGVPLWLDAPLEELVLDDGRVVGVRTTKDGRRVTVGATRGVMLAGGGFDQNVQWRQKYHGIDGDPSGAPGNLGGPIEMAAGVGAALELMDEAWWGASVAAPTGGGPAFLVGERSFPFSLMVDSRGDRFANESESYVDLGHHMLAHDKDGAYWLVADAHHTHRYLRGFALDPKAGKAMAQEGISVRADTIAELAPMIGAEPARLTATIERFNGFAHAGIDGDFGRGNSAYDRYYSDPSVHPNPNLGALTRAPFRAYRVVIGDLGTKGGVVTDEHARALREDGSVIEGLYSAGNCSAAVMGRTYPGPGSTLGPAVVFGTRAGRHLAGR